MGWAGEQGVFHVLPQSVFILFHCPQGCSTERGRQHSKENIPEWPSVPPVNPSAPGANSLQPSARALPVHMSNEFGLSYGTETKNAIDATTNSTSFTKYRLPCESFLPLPWDLQAYKVSHGATSVAHLVRLWLLFDCPWASPSKSVSHFRKTPLDVVPDTGKCWECSRAKEKSCRWEWFCTGRSFTTFTHRATGNNIFPTATLKSKHHTSFWDWIYSTSYHSFQG